MRPGKQASGLPSSDRAALGRHKIVTLYQSNGAWDVQRLGDDKGTMFIQRSKTVVHWAKIYDLEN